MNRLQHETSPYLLQHADNPVDWYAWSQEAFDRAQKEDKPILVSIGYSTCHWCHVMERESFEDPDTAALMNEYFINIKVDREERPDVDQIYMEACQAFTGHGGWPLNCFLTPDGRPFYAGTYFPPRAAHNRPSWNQLLHHLARVFREERSKVEEQANRLTGIIQRSDAVFLKDKLEPESPADVFSEDYQHRLFEQMRGHFDREYGGFGGAPKFPPSMSLQYLMEYAHFYGEKDALHHVGHSLDKMIRGGIYDQLGGGFARYATDRAWLVPHFEKMLYDNALLVGLMADAYKLTQNPLYRETTEATLQFIQREMTSTEGGFYSALDADSEGEEGKFYVWDKAEVDEVLGEDSALFCQFYGVTEQGNWEGKNILWRAQSLAAFAARHNLEEQELRRQFTQNRQQLLERRAERIRPGLDDKILLGWNALMSSAYVKAGQALKREAYIEAARRNIDFLLERLVQPDGKRMLHTYKDGKARHNAFLDDNAFLIAALMDVYESTFEDKYLLKAHSLMEKAQHRFLDPDNQLFYYTAAEQKDVIVRKKDLYDSSVPSGNSTMVHNLLRLADFFNKADYRDQAVAMLRPMLETVEQYPTTFSRWAQATLYLATTSWEIAVVGEEAIRKAAALNAHFLPNRVIMAAPDADSRYPLLAGKEKGSPAKIYACRQYACQRPVTEVEEALKMVSP